jgi:glycosyltransferase involved in cell wall biosynthesis
VIDNGKEGLIVAQRDADALAGAIGELIRDHARRLSLGSSAARKVRDKFDVAKCEHIFHDRLAALLSSRSQLNSGARRDRKADRVFSHYGN